ncbi:hypothetical protein KW782_03270 [Candidatus Parcubacteria bacterium]|nr:hypothetical protein [Candidatus Parcubacteria bacterium]
MSMTVSPGLQRISRWYGVAASVAEYLQHVIDGTSGGRIVPRGALKGLEQFFVCILEGYRINQNLGRQRAYVRIMAGISCYAIAEQVMTSRNPYGLKPAAETIESEAWAHSEIVRRLIIGCPMTERMDSVQGLFNFTYVMMSLGLADREQQRVENTDVHE